MKSGSNEGGTPEIFESPEIMYMDIMTQGILCASSTYGSYINDANQEDEDIFGNILYL